MAGGQLIWTDSLSLSTTGSAEDATDGGYLVTRDWKEICIAEPEDDNGNHAIDTVRPRLFS